MLVAGMAQELSAGALKMDIYEDYAKIHLGILMLSFWLCY